MMTLNTVRHNADGTVSKGTITIATPKAARPRPVRPTTSNAVIATAPHLGGNLDAKSNVIFNLGAPTSDNNAATKIYVDKAVLDGSTLPTSDPGVAGKLWNSSGTVMVSARKK